MGVKSSLIITVSDIKNAERDTIGKKIHELGILQSLGIPIPDGFIITCGFFKEFLRLTGIDKEIEKTNASYHPALEDSIDKFYYPVRKKIKESNLHQVLATEFHRYYRNFCGSLKNKPLNVFSSSVGDKSIVFSGVSGDANLLLKIKNIWSQSFREPTAIAVQESIKTGISGKILTNKPCVNKKLNKQQANTLINYCRLIQRYFYFPKEIEYIIKDNHIYVTKIYPYTGTPGFSRTVKERKVLAKGTGVNPGIVTGPVKVLSPKQKDIRIKKGEVIILPKLDQSLFAKIKNAKGVVVSQVWPDSPDKVHYKRDLRIPTVEGIDNATDIFHNGNVITVNGINGEIYSGGLI